jgi:hypothetical protein
MANKSVVMKALVCCVATFSICVALLVIFIGMPVSETGASEAIGALAAPLMLAAVPCVWFARKAPVPWPWPKFVGIYIAMVIVIQVFATYGRISHH